MSLAVSWPQEHVTINVMNFSSSSAVIFDRAVGLPLAKRSGKLAIMIPAVAYGHRNRKAVSACDLGTRVATITVNVKHPILALAIDNICNTYGQALILKTQCLSDSKIILHSKLKITNMRRARAFID